MPLKEQAHVPKDGRTAKRRSTPPKAAPMTLNQPSPDGLSDPASLAPDEVLQLQRTIGNQAVGRLLAGRQPVQVNAAGAVPSLQREWNVDTYRNSNVEGYNALLTLVGWTGAKGKPKTRAAGRLRALAEKTDSPEQLKGLLQKVGEHTVLGTLLESATAAQVEKLIAVIPTGEALQQLLTTVGGGDNLTTYYSTITTNEVELYKLLKLETDLAVLTQLKAAITDTDILIKVLVTTPAGGVGRGAFLRQTIQKAGDWASLRYLANRYIFDIGLLRKLLDAASFQKLKALGDKQGNTLVKGKAEIVLELLNYTDFDTAAAVIEGNPTATADAWKILATKKKLGTQATGAKVHPMAIRFSQATVTNRGDGYTVTGNIEKLKREPDWDIPGDPIRVFNKTSAMDVSIPGRHSDQFGDSSPTFLEDGQTYTLDNRRLYAYQQAGRNTMPAPQFAPFNVIKREAYKFTTEDFGRSALLV